jgi:hypothetical protein
MIILFVVLFCVIVAASGMNRKDNIEAEIEHFIQRATKCPFLTWVIDLDDRSSLLVRAQNEDRSISCVFMDSSTGEQIRRLLPSVDGDFDQASLRRIITSRQLGPSAF